MKKITIYSTPSCHFCKDAKALFTEMGLEYTEHDVSKDLPRKTEMTLLSGQIGVPVITIDDVVIVGFNKKRILANLEK